MERHAGARTRTVTVLDEVRAVDDRHAPEFPRIGEAHGGSVGETDDGAHERVVGGARLAEEQLPGHAE